MQSDSPQSPSSLAGRSVLVVGAGGGGIGTDTALCLAEAGARVVAADWIEERVDEVVALLADRGHECVGLVADARDPEQANDLVARSIEAVGALRGLVNVVGGTQPGTWQRMEDYTDELYDEVLNLNLRTAFLTTRATARHMLEVGDGGSIVNFSSVSGLRAAPYHGLYGAAKAAVGSLTRTMAVEWGYSGIRVNAIAPSRVQTPRVVRGGGTREEAIANPLRRNIEVREVANVALFLISDMSSALTGQTYNVDAGVTAESPAGPAKAFAVRLPGGKS